MGILVLAERQSSRKQGITGDLEAMQRAGIGGVLIMSIAGGVKPGPVEFMSAEWRDIFLHMVPKPIASGSKST